jgi:very-short-patch-repair endonuclease
VTKRKVGLPVCVCGCGRKVAKIGNYSKAHITNPIESLKALCACGCGNFTSGCITTGGKVPIRLNHHTANARKKPSNKLCICGCGIAISSKRDYEYAPWHIKKSCEKLIIDCMCGCGKKTSGRIHTNTGKPVGFFNGHSNSREKNTSYYTDIEKVAAGILDELGIKYEHNKSVGPFFLDFAIGKFALETDGDYWHSRRKNKISDKRKDTYLVNRGWTVVRILGSKIRENRNIVAIRLKPYMAMLKESHD